MKKPSFLSTNALRGFIEAGGKLEYEVFSQHNKRMWFVFGIFPNGDRQQVYVGRTGEQCILKSANGVIAHHLTYFPDSRSVNVPL